MRGRVGMEGGRGEGDKKLEIRRKKVSLERCGESGKEKDGGWMK